MASTENILTGGARLMERYLTEKGLKQTHAAKALDVSDPTVSDWLSGEKRPRAETRDLIETWTGGAVPAGAWKTAEEIAAQQAMAAEAAARHASPVPAVEPA